MAIRVDNVQGKILGQDSTCSMPHFVCSPWWNSQEEQMSQTLSKNLSLRVESPSLCFEQAKHLGRPSEDQSSPSSESSSQSQRQVTVMTKSNSQDQSVSSESVQNESFDKYVEEQPKSAFFVSNLDFPAHASQIEFSQSAAQLPYIYSDPYFSGLYSAYGPQAMIQQQMMGIAPGRVPLPPDLAQDGPIYVNAKQYHGILRRRQMRAKLEAQNKLVKRKPYLHESRHQHALNRVRGSGGRFLSTKKQQQHDSIFSSGSLSASAYSHQEENMLEMMEAERCNDNRHNASITTSSSAMGFSHGHDLIFQQHANMSAVSVSHQMSGSLPGVGGVTHNGTLHRVPTTR